MAKSFKEYLGVPTIRVGGLDSMHPIASLGDTPPKGQGSRDTRAVGLTASKKLQQKNWKEKGHGPYRKEELNNTPLYNYLVDNGVLSNKE